MKTNMIAAFVVLSACSTQKEPEPRQLKKVEQIGVLESAADEPLTDRQRAERDRMVATAQLRAKLGSKDATSIQPLHGGGVREARTMQQELQEIREQRSGLTASGK